MFRRLRAVHKWVGVCAALFLALISFTGFVLAIKGKSPAIRPVTQRGQELQNFSDAITLNVAAQAAIGVGLPELRTLADIDRFEYHLDKNVFKVLSVKAYHEVQVCAATGKVLSVGKRNDQLFEDIHDLSFFGDEIYEWWLPIVAVGLFVLAVSGLVMFGVPIVRRWKYERSRR